MMRSALIRSIIKKGLGKAFSLLAFWLVGSVLVPSCGLGAVNPNEILESIYERQGLKNGSYVMEIEAVTYEGRKEDKARIRVYLGENGQQAVTFLEPLRLSDQIYLVVGYNTWMYQEGLHRPIRISARQRLFGEAGIAETVGIDYLRDYRVSGFSENESEYIMDVEALDTKTAYRRARLWIEKKSLRLVKAVLTAVSGDPLKELTFTAYQNINGHEVSIISIKNLLMDKDHRTELRFLNITPKHLPDQAFQPMMIGSFKLMVNE